MVFTQAQLATWVAYEAVRQEGNYNMFSQQAIDSTGLTKDEYFFVMKNFTALAAEVRKQEGISA